MTDTDVDAFAEALTKLAACFPASKIDIGLVLPVYFGKLQHLSLAAVQALFSAVLDTCRHFPTIVELVDLARTCGATPAATCRMCPEGHGVHAGHKVTHYPAGPYCTSCNVDMPTTKGYMYHAPATAVPAPSGVPLLSEHGAAPLTLEEVRALVAKVCGCLPQDDTPLSVRQRKAQLRAQLAALHGTGGAQ